MNDSLYEKLKLARGRSVPLIAVETGDQLAAARTCLKLAAERLAKAEANGQRVQCGVIEWDLVRGPHIVDPNAMKLDNTRDILSLSGALLDQLLQTADRNPDELTDWPEFSGWLPSIRPPARAKGEPLVPGPIVVLLNAHKLIASGKDDERGVQAVMNLRDAFAARNTTLVMLCPSWPAPTELASDVMVVSEALPTDEEREAEIRSTIERAIRGGAEITDVERLVRDGVNVTRSLTRFAVAQAVALSTDKTGLDLKVLGERFVQAVNECPGLTFIEPGNPDDIGGLSAWKVMAKRLKNSRRPIQAILWIDEIEKAMAGASGNAGDSGVSANMLGDWLTFMSETKANGVIAAGPGGTGKSVSAIALAAYLGVPCIKVDIGELKSKWVGDTGARTRQLFAKVVSLAPNSFWVATLNDMREDAIPGPFRRRFKRGTYMFDLPDTEERESIWAVHRRLNEIPADEPNPPSEGWTGANIAACCEQAYEERLTLSEAAEEIIPAAVDMSTEIAQCRRVATGKWKSAHKPGRYTPPVGVTGESGGFDL